MSNHKERTAARLPLVSEEIVAGYAAAMAGLPRVRIILRRPCISRELPAVGSFG